jgi:hypothetical protein
MKDAREKECSTGGRGKRTALAGKTAGRNYLLALRYR